MKEGNTITRFPNPAGLMRGPNMLTRQCGSCGEERTHGYNIYMPYFHLAIFACDECLTEARKRNKLTSEVKPVSVVSESQR